MNEFENALNIVQQLSPIQQNLLIACFKWNQDDPGDPVQVVRSFYESINQELIHTDEQIMIQYNNVLTNCDLDYIFGRSLLKAPDLALVAVIFHFEQVGHENETMLAKFLLYKDYDVYDLEEQGFNEDQIARAKQLKTRMFNGVLFTKYNAGWSKETERIQFFNYVAREARIIVTNQIEQRRVRLVRQFNPI